MVKQCQHAALILFSIYSTEPILLHSSIIDRGIYPIVYSNAACHPWDNGLAECEKDNYMSLSCPAGNVAGIFCLDGHGEQWNPK